MTILKHHSSHIFFNQQKNVFAIDYDYFNLWHPYWDLSRFVGGMSKIFSQRKVAILEDIFLNEYFTNTREIKKVKENKIYLFGISFMLKDIIIEQITKFGIKKIRTFVQRILASLKENNKKLYEK